MALTENDVARAYTDTAVKTVTAGPMLLVALYDRLTHDVSLAGEYLGGGDFERADDALQHAQKIVTVLRSSLQVDGFTGGDDLRRLYNTLIDLFVKANLEKDATITARCQEIIGPLHRAWTDAVARVLEGSSVGAAIGVG